MRDRINVGITGLGSYLPETVVTNKDLEEFLREGKSEDWKGKTSDEWITQRTGIETRRFASPEESLPVMMAVAAKRALRDANLTPEDIDCIFTAHNQTDPLLVPHEAARLQHLIGARNIPCSDISNGCSGVVGATEIAVNLIRGRWHYDTSEEEVRGEKVVKHRNTKVLLIGGDTLTNVTPMEDRRSAVILSDGAGAAVLEPEYDAEFGILCTINKTFGNLGARIHYGYEPYNQLTGTKPLRFDKTGGRVRPFVMNGNEVHKFIGRQAPGLIEELIAGSGLELEVLKEAVVIPHQMNLRSINLCIDKVKSSLGCTPKFVYTQGVIRYGNTSTASQLIGFDELHRRVLEKEFGLEGPILDLYTPVIAVAFGAGLTLGGFLMRWNRHALSEPIKYDMSEQREMIGEMNERYNHWKEGLAR